MENREREKQERVHITFAAVTKKVCFLTAQNKKRFKIMEMKKYMHIIFNIIKV